MAGRIDTGDYEYLMGSSFGGATTLSEKLRAALSFFRKFNEGTESFEESLEVVEALLGKGRRAVLASEMRAGVRSELVHMCLDHTPALLALLASHGGGGKGAEAGDEALRGLEERLARQLLPFVESFLRLAMTKRAPCYNPSILKERLDGIRDAAGAIAGSDGPDTAGAKKDNLE
ncbi:MAG: hypothetical protein JJU00_17245 [Opitutales bacterium]|nr:hypothetical protein [Opitutales bacterium]